MNLTDEQLIGACAELDGCRPLHNWWCNNCGAWVKPIAVTNDERHDETFEGCGRPVDIAPDYLNSRDAIIGVIEKTIQHKLNLQHKFYYELGKVLILLIDPKEATIGITISMLFATPRQLATALVRATGKDKQ